MILKIRCDNDVSLADYSWWFMDDIRKVSTKSIMGAEPGKCPGATGAGHNPEIEYDVSLVFHLDQTCPSFMVLICRRTDSTEFSIAFDTVAYLMNDHGETIEKIVGNPAFA